MRLLRAVVALCAFSASVRADEARLVPAAGSTLTYRVVTTSKTSDKTIVFGEIYAYVVASSDGTVAEGAIRPIALLFGCRGHEDDADCIRAKTAPVAREEDGFTVVPVPAALADRLAAQSAIKWRAFIIEQRKATYLLSLAGRRSNEDFFAGDDPLIVANTMACDPAALAAFMPLGKAPEATISCKTSFERTGGRMKPMSNVASGSLDVSYAGTGRVSLPSGEWDVRKLSLKPTISPSGPMSAHTEIQFSDKLGAAVTTRSTAENSSGKFVTESDSVLIAVSP